MLLALCVPAPHLKGCKPQTIARACCGERVLKPVGEGRGRRESRIRHDCGPSGVDSGGLEGRCTFNKVFAGPQGSPKSKSNGSRVQVSGAVALLGSPVPREILAICPGDTQ